MEKENRFVSNDGAFRDDDARLDQTDREILEEFREGGGIPIRTPWQRWFPPSSQPMGMALSDRAAEMHGEDYEKPPWN